MTYWYMQLHPGNDPLGHHADRMRDVVLRWRDVGMGDERQWRDGGVDTRRRFREVMQIGDVIALAHGRRMIALVRVSGEYGRNDAKTDDHWYGVRRPVEILCDDPAPYLDLYVRTRNRAPAEGLPIRSTLSQIRKNEFVGFWYEMLGGADLSGRSAPSGVPRKTAMHVTEWSRDSRIVDAARRRAKCERCGKSRTFVKPDGRQYMEAHHLIRMAHQGVFSRTLDTLANVVCLCPECHRFLHFGSEAEVKVALNRFYKDRADALRQAGLVNSRSQFFQYALNR